ncbi:MAG: hypothetical protein ACQBVK_05075 [Candidatus Phytoplasma sp. TWB_XP]
MTEYDPETEEPIKENLLQF